MGKQVIDPANDESPVWPGVVWTTGLGAIALGVSALIGWGLGSPALKQLVPGLPSARPTTAVCLILLGIGVISLIGRSRARWVGAAATAGVGLIAGVSLLQYAFGMHLLLDGLLFRDAVDREPYGGRMALATAIEFTVMTSALVAASRGKRQLAQGLGLIVLTGGAVAVLGYAYGERRLYATETQAGMAFNTALALTLMSVGLLAAIPDSVLSHLFRRPAPGALLSRRLLPWMTIVMPLIGWLRIEGERRGLFGPALGTSIMVFAGSIVVVVIARLAAMTMDHLALSLNHAWHQYGLASASEQSRIRSDRVPPPTIETHDRITLDSEEDRRQIWLDR